MHSFCANKLGHWVSGRKGGWKDGRAGLRITYSNQKQIPGEKCHRAKCFDNLHICTGCKWCLYFHLVHLELNIVHTREKTTAISQNSTCSKLKKSNWIQIKLAGFNNVSFCWQLSIVVLDIEWQRPNDWTFSSIMNDLGETSNIKDCKLFIVYGLFSDSYLFWFEYVASGHTTFFVCKWNHVLCEYNPVFDCCKQSLKRV